MQGSEPCVTQHLGPFFGDVRLAVLSSLVSFPRQVGGLYAPAQWLRSAEHSTILSVSTRSLRASPSPRTGLLGVWVEDIQHQSQHSADAHSTSRQGLPVANHVCLELVEFLSCSWHCHSKDSVMPEYLSQEPDPLLLWQVASACRVRAWPCGE